MEVHVNLLAVLLATASSMVVGSVWYARPVFGNLWIKLAKVDMKKQGSALAPILTTLIVSFLTAFVLAHVSYLAHSYFGNAFFKDAITTGFWLWLGFTAARFMTHDAFEGRPKALTLLNIAHEFVTILIMAAIIGAFKP